MRIPHGRVPLDLTDDGRLVVFTAKSRESWVDTGGALYSPTGVPRGVMSAEVWIAHVTDGSAEQVSKPGSRAWAPRFSPDEKRLAFFSDAGGQTRLWIHDLASGLGVAVDGGVARPFFAFELPEWSPDGRYVYFKVLSADFERFASRANVHFPQEALPFEPKLSEGEDSEGLVRIVRSARGGADEAVSATVPEGLRDGRGILDLVRFDTVERKLVRIAFGLALRDYDVSPDGHSIAMTIHRGTETGAQQPVFSLRVLRTDAKPGTTPRVLDDAVREAYGVSTSWSPDSTRLAIVTSGPLSEGDAWVYDIASGEGRNLTAALDTELGRGDWHESRPLWTRDGAALVFAGDGELWRIAADGSGAESLTESFAPDARDAVSRSESSVAWERDGKLLMQFLDRETQEHGFALVDAAAGGVRELWRTSSRLPGVLRHHVDIAADADTVVFRAESERHPTRLHRSDVGFDDVRELPGANPWLAEVDLGRRETLYWTLEDGTEAAGLLLLPSTTAATPPPCVVKVYAGSNPSRAARRFSPGGSAESDNVALFLARGMAVFLPDMPIGDEEPMAAIHRVTEPALDALAASGKVDMDRLGVFGHSYGGYTVNALVTQTTRFRAAAASAGIANLVSKFLHEAGQGRGTGWFETGQGRMRATLWEDTDRYARNSPALFADKVETPLLLVHGTDDWYYEQSEEMYGALRRLGKECEFVTYPHAEHWYGAWSNAQLRDFWGRLLDWFDEHLAPRPEPTQKRAER